MMKRISPAARDSRLVFDREFRVSSVFWPRGETFLHFPSRLLPGSLLPGRLWAA